MILEVAIISIDPQHKPQFEAAFKQARELICSMPGFVSHQLHRCIETDGRYLLLVQWLSVEHHMVGFRQSPQFQQWRALLGPYFASAPVVEHYDAISKGDKA
ncbi:MAG TPA: antibiotic biosynthesis monooxygenase [Steroidobacteraceae bacterium]|jgi:heme-degrading monooxygenase HmoA